MKIMFINTKINSNSTILSSVQQPQQTQKKKLIIKPIEIAPLHSTTILPISPQRKPNAVRPAGIPFGTGARTADLGNREKSR